MSVSPGPRDGSPAAHTFEHEDAKPVNSEPVDETPAEPVHTAEEDHDEAPAADGGDAEDAEEEEQQEAGADVSDDESILSEVDEAQFEDFDPATVDVEDRPQLAIDEENLKLIGRHKRKRDEEGGEGDRPRRKKEGRREKKSRRIQELNDGGERVRRRERKRKEATPENEELLDPATRMFYLYSTRCPLLTKWMDRSSQRVGPSHGRGC